jgi:chromatin remodeling complex protein RSC6
MATSKKGGSSKASKGGAKKGGGRSLGGDVTPSAELGAIVGTKAMPRTEVTKKLWDYIKANGLQDSQNRRMINADDKLRPIFGGKKQVSMFDMTALVSKHLKS